MEESVDDAMEWEAVEIGLLGYQNMLNRQIGRQLRYLLLLLPYVYTA